MNESGKYVSSTGPTSGMLQAYINACEYKSTLESKEQNEEHELFQSNDCVVSE